jgi:hypothetical protein
VSEQKKPGGSNQHRPLCGGVAATSLGHASQVAQRDQPFLAVGDILPIRAKDGLVRVGGEVLFPNIAARDLALGMKHLTDRAGGYSWVADNNRDEVDYRNGASNRTRPPACSATYP